MKKIIKALAVFEQAVRADEFKGSQDPRDYHIIEEEYQQAKENLLKLIKELGEH